MLKILNIGIIYVSLVKNAPWFVYKPWHIKKEFI